MRHLILSTFLLLLTTIGFSQPLFNLSFTEVTNDGTTYTVDMYLAFSSAGKLASSNFVFNYNTAGMSNPTFVSTDLAGPPFYSVGATEPTTGRVSLNVVLSFLGFGNEITSTPFRIGRITFNVDDPAQNSNLIWVYDGDGATTGTVVFRDDVTGTTQLNAGTLTDMNTPLPVELLSFTGKPIDNRKTALRWETASETNNLGFEIERMDENREWKNIGFEKGFGDTEFYQQYFHYDLHPLPGTNYYRLKQIDLDSKFEYSNTIAVTFEEGAISSDWDISPNPASTHWEIRTEEEGLIRMFDLSGSLVKEQLVSNASRIDISELASGTYFIRFKAEVKKLVVQK